MRQSVGRVQSDGRAIAVDSLRVTVQVRQNLAAAQEGLGVLRILLQRGCVTGERLGIFLLQSQRIAELNPRVRAAWPYGQGNSERGLSFGISFLGDEQPAELVVSQA